MPKIRKIRQNHHFLIESLAGLFFFGILPMVETKHKVIPLLSSDQTAAEMVRIVKEHAADIGEKAKWSLIQFFRFVSQLPFHADPKGHESLSRPSYTMQEAWPWRDCDDKSILIASWCWLNSIPFKFRASSKRDDGHLHHVYVMALIGGKWITIDATYPHNSLGIETPGITARKDLTGEIHNMSPNQATLNVYEGEAPELMGSSFFRKLRKAASYTPAGMVYDRRHKIARGAKSIHDHTPAGMAEKAFFGESPDLMGSSFWKRMARKSSNVVKQVAKSPIGSIADAATGGQFSRYANIATRNLDRARGAAAAAPIAVELPAAPIKKGLPKWAIPAGAAAAVLLLLLVTRKPGSSNAVSSSNG